MRVEYHSNLGKIFQRKNIFLLLLRYVSPFNHISDSGMPQYLSILVAVALFVGTGAQIIDPLECTEVGTQGNLTGQVSLSSS